MGCFISQVEGGCPMTSHCRAKHDLVNFTNYFYSSDAAEHQRNEKDSIFTYGFLYVLRTAFL